MRRARKRRLPWRLARLLIFTICLYLSACTVGLVLLRWVDPLFTSVHVQRRVEALWSDEAYRHRYQFVPLDRISPHLRHAAVASEDSRFLRHSGIDWREVEIVVTKEAPRGRIRGASTITQQLVKNLFMTTYRNPVRKPFELLLAPVAEAVLTKDRILELYLNVIEWAPGAYGAEAASRHHYGISASALTREQAARLAACIPAPRSWRPGRMDRSSARILGRMERMGW